MYRQLFVLLMLCVVVSLTSCATDGDGTLLSIFSKEEAQEMSVLELERRKAAPLIINRFSFFRSMGFECYYITEVYDSVTNCIKDRYKLSRTFPIGKEVEGPHKEKFTTPFRSEFKLTLRDYAGGWILSIYGPAQVYNLEEKTIGKDELEYSLIFDVRRETNREFKRVDQLLQHYEEPLDGRPKVSKILFAITGVIVFMNLLNSASLLINQRSIDTAPSNKYLKWLNPQWPLFSYPSAVWQVCFWASMILDKYLY